VCRYGADPTGANDSTAAFNAATLHSLEYSLDALLIEIVVPAGRFTLNGTVYLRKGQRLRGAAGASVIVCNIAGRGPTFKLGWGLIDKLEKLDPGGQPVSLESLFMLGGPAAGCIDCTQVAGAFLKDLFISASALALHIHESADLNVENLIFDQGQVAISIVGSANCQFSLLKFYLMNYDLSISGATHDCQWSNCHSEYNRYSSILFAESSAGICNLEFTDWQLLYNPTNRSHYGTYLGAIHNRAPGVDARFNGCTFSNMPGYAYVHGTATGGRLKFANCIFDGERTGSAYVRSTGAAAVKTLDESVTLTGCSFRNLAVTPIVVGGTTPTTVDISGGDYTGNGGASFVEVSNRSTASAVRVTDLRGDGSQTLVNNQPTVPVTTRNCVDWFGAVRTAGVRRYVLVPYQLSTVYQIMLRASVSPGGDANLRKSVMLLAEKDNDGSGGGRSFINTSASIQGAANVKSAVAIAVEFDKVGGGTDIGESNSGSIAISWPGEYANASIDIQMI
jgi:hypothetical protein